MSRNLFNVKQLRSGRNPIQDMQLCSRPSQRSGHTPSARCSLHCLAMCRGNLQRSVISAERGNLRVANESKTAFVYWPCVVYFFMIVRALLAQKPAGAQLKCSPIQLF